MKIVKFYLKPVALCTCLAMTAQSNAQNEKLPTDEDTPWEHAPKDYQIAEDMVYGASFIDRIPELLHREAHPIHLTVF